jgi:hypothetical protein
VAVHLSSHGELKPVKRAQRPAVQFDPNALGLALPKPVAQTLGTIFPLGRCAVHAAEIDWSTGEFEWVRNSRVLVATLPRSPIPTKAKKTALYAPAAVRFSQPAPSSGGLLNVGKRVPKFEPPDAEASTVFGAPLHLTIGQDKRS